MRARNDRAVEVSLGATPCEFCGDRIDGHAPSELRSCAADIACRDSGPGAALIAIERLRQIEVEGWTPDHDDEHDEGELAMAAVVYAATAIAQTNQTTAYEVVVASLWPWGSTDRKPSDDPIRNLVKAGALIAAEIDRLERER